GLRQAVAEEAKPLDLEKEYADRFPIVKTKRFVMKPMDTEEAIMQMNLLGHNFFMFYNANTGSINVVYKRMDGNYGLIEPD
ncbi:MAG: ribosome-associated translation inhibitor RaiA, partial [Syntrophomonadaceae bacterium]|nr:ribosome-associated translation inhibitor RaiA [Syntrophomonadaceae bacterium]